MDEYVDVAADFEDALDDRVDGFAVAKVDGVVVDPGPGRLDGVQRAQRRTSALDPGQLLVDEGGRGPLTGRLQPLEDRPLQAVLVGAEGGDVGVGRVGLGDQVEQVERPVRGPSEVGGDRRDDAAGCAGDGEHRVVAELDARWRGSEGNLAQRHRPPLAASVADFNRSRVAQGLLHEQVGNGLGVRVLGDVDRLHRARRGSRA